MSKVTARLLLIIAMMLMPFGMVPVAASVASHGAMASLPMGHCPDQGSSHDMKGGIAECTMACAAALPAADLARDGALVIMCVPIQPATAQRLRGLHPETATPPPKRS